MKTLVKRLTRVVVVALAALAVSASAADSDKDKAAKAKAAADARALVVQSARAAHSVRVGAFSFVKFVVCSHADQLGKPCKKADDKKDD